MNTFSNLTKSAILFSAIFVVMLCAHSVLIYLNISHAIPTDFQALYFSGKSFIATGNPYIIPVINTSTHVTTHTVTPSLSSPFFSYVIGHLSNHISHLTAYALWSGLTVIMLIIATYLSDKYLLANAMNYRFIQRLCFLLIFPPVLINISYGQFAIILCILIVSAMIFLKKDRIVMAAVFLAVATNIKSFVLFFLIYGLAKKKYKFTSLYLVLTIAIGIIPFYPHWLSIYKSYFMALDNIRWYANNWNSSFNGILSRLLGNFKSYQRSLTNFPMLSTTVYFSLSIIYTVATFFSIRRCNDFITNMATLLSTMLLICPLGWCYYFPLLYVPFLYLKKLFSTDYSYRNQLILLFIALFFACTTYPFIAGKDVSTGFLVGWSNVGFISLFIFTNLSLWASFKATQSTTSSSNPLNLDHLMPIFAFISLCCYIAIFTGFLRVKVPKSDYVYTFDRSVVSMEMQRKENQ